MTQEMSVPIQILHLIILEQFNESGLPQIYKANMFLGISCKIRFACLVKLNSQNHKRNLQKTYKTSQKELN